MAFVPDEYAHDAQPVIQQVHEAGVAWAPIYRHGCNFDAAIFHSVMMNLIKNPNLLSSWLFRADILHESDHGLHEEMPCFDKQPPVPTLHGFDLKRIVVRKLIPRSTKRDEPLDQTCVFYQGNRPDGRQLSLLLYLPHVASQAEVPFYHPQVRGVGYLHERSESDQLGTISVHYSFFSDEEPSVKLRRTALNLLTVLHKHGEGRLSGYVKRVHHDTIIGQARVQDRYHALKEKYSRNLIHNWMECTDPGKHVFEDLCIAAFLIELWADMYADTQFPGFVDIGCGNGLLVHLLNEEGYRGWGFDARSRKSWSQYGKVLSIDGDAEETGSNKSLMELILLPSIIHQPEMADPDGRTDAQLSAARIHHGRFPEGTFIISNHADELTPWTPILAALSGCPFIAIPCCSHNLAGARFRAAPPKDKTKSASAYASLVEWVHNIAEDCGWEVEREMLRIPSTRNAALLGRRKARDHATINAQEVLAKYGGTDGYLDNVLKLVKTGPCSH